MMLKIVQPASNYAFLVKQTARKQKYLLSTKKAPEIQFDIVSLVKLWMGNYALIKNKFLKQINALQS